VYIETNDESPSEVSFSDESPQRQRSTSPLSTNLSPGMFMYDSPTTDRTSSLCY